MLLPEVNVVGGGSCASVEIKLNEALGVPPVAFVTLLNSSMGMTRCPEGACSSGMTIDPGGMIILTSPGPGNINLLAPMSSIALSCMSVRAPSSPGS